MCLARGSETPREIHVAGRMGKAGRGLDKVLSTKEAAFISQHNGISSPHLMSHIISCVFMGFWGGIKPYKGMIAELTTSSRYTLPLP